MMESNTELKKLQETKLKNFEGLRKTGSDREDDPEILKVIKDAESKARQEEIEKHSIIVQQLKGQITDLKSQLVSRESENEDLHSELEIIRSRPISVASSRGDIRILNGDFSEQYEESLGHLRDKVAELTLQLREKCLETEQLMMECESNSFIHSKTIQDFEEEMDRMENQFREETAMLREDLEAVHRENDQLAQELDALHNICRENDLRHHEETKAQVDNQKQEITDLTQSLEKAGIRYLYVKNELEIKSKELLNLTESLKKSNSQVTALEQSINERDEELNEIHCQLELKIKEVESKEKLHEEIVSDLKGKLSMNKTKITEMSAVKDTTAKQISLLRQELENYTTQIEEIKQNLNYEIEQ
ncbi:13427_t:CDS:2, partial [Acaulospora colombiana]